MEDSVVTTLPCGDPGRMGRLLMGLQPRLVAVARRMLRDSEAAADVVQNAIEKVLRHCERFRGRSKPSTWMHRIVVNEALMWMRTERRRGPGLVDPEDWRMVYGIEDGPELGAARREESSRVARAFEELSAEDRALLADTAFEGRPHEELARELGVSAAAVKARAFRARRRLARRLRDPS